MSDYLFLLAGADTGRLLCFELCSITFQSDFSAQPMTDLGGPVLLLNLSLSDKTADLGLFVTVLLFTSDDTA